MSFRSPWYLLALLVLVAAAAVWRLAQRRRVRYAVRYPNLDVLASVLPERSWSRYIAPLLFLLGLSVLVVALARPQVDRMRVEDRATVILVVDTSRSMQAKDVKPTRLGAAQGALRTFLKKAPAGLRVGLIVFAGDAQVAAPPTRDKKLVATAVDEIDNFTVFGGTAIGDALQAAVELGKRAVGGGESAGAGLSAPAPSRGARSLAQATPPRTHSPVSILFLSDGEQTRGVLQPLEGAALAKKAGFPVYTVALGTPNGELDLGALGPSGGVFPDGFNRTVPVPPDPQTLRAIADMTGGAFSEATTASRLQKAYADLGSRLGRVPGKTEVTFLFAGVAALLLVLAGAAAVVLGPRLP